MDLPDPSPVPNAVIYGCSGTALSADEKRFFADARPAGFILFERNCRNPDQVRGLVHDLLDCIGQPQAPILIDPVATKQLSVPTGINPASPDDIPSDNLINTGDLEGFLKSVSLDGRTQIQQDALLWAEIWTYNNPAMRFGGNDVLFLLNQLPDPLPREQVDALVANAVLASKN